VLYSCSGKFGTGGALRSPFPSLSFPSSTLPFPLLSSLALSSLPLPLLALPSRPSSPSLPLDVGPLNPARGWGEL